MTLKKLRQIGKKAVSLGLAAITAGYIVAAPKQVHAQANRPPLEVKVEDVFDYKKQFNNDKLRTTIDSGRFSFRLDKNEGRQSQYLFTLKPVDNQDTKLTLIHAGGVGDSNNIQNYTFGAGFSQNIGNLPIIGETSLNLSGKSTINIGDKPSHRYSVKLYGERADLAYKGVISSDGKLDHRYYYAFHNDYLHASLGKTKGRQIKGVLVTKNNPSLGLFVIGGYDLESRVLSFTLKNAFSNANTNIYNQDIGRLASKLMILGTVEVNRPIFSSYLTLGDITNNIELRAGQGKYLVEAEIGRKIGKNVGVGAGLSVKKERDGKVEVKPIISGYFKAKVLGQDLHFQASLKDGGVSCYAYTQIIF